MLAAGGNIEKKGRQDKGSVQCAGRNSLVSQVFFAVVVEHSSVFNHHYKKISWNMTRG